MWAQLLRANKLDNTRSHVSVCPFDRQFGILEAANNWAPPINILRHIPHLQGGMTKFQRRPARPSERLCNKLCGGVDGALRCFPARIEGTRRPLRTGWRPSDRGNEPRGTNADPLIVSWLRTHL
uniref:Uncharacterized protein n=1 Tax=Trichuris muris TaxID=70415 RepID=A0A5S6Q6T6_TRIMR